MNWELAPISGDPETDSLAERRWTVTSLTFSFPSSADQFTGRVSERLFRGERGFPQSYMMEDIAALQFLYGANFTTNSGNTVYRLSASTGEMSINGVGQGAPLVNTVFLTIWDGGGIDTYDFSNYNSTLSIDLEPGQWTRIPAQTSDLGSTLPGSIANAHLYNNDGHWRQLRKHNPRQQRQQHTQRARRQ